MNASGRVHVYRMRQPWQSIYALLGFCAWAGVLPCAVFQGWSVFRWTRRIWPALTRMLQGEPVSQVSVSEAGLICRFWPLLEVWTGWDEVEYLPEQGRRRACLRLRRWQGQGYGEFAWLPGGMQVVLKIFEKGLKEDLQAFLINKPEKWM